MHTPHAHAPPLHRPRWPPTSPTSWTVSPKGWAPPPSTPHSNACCGCVRGRLRVSMSYDACVSRSLWWCRGAALAWNVCARCSKALVSYLRGQVPYFGVALQPVLPSRPPSPLPSPSSPHLTNRPRCWTPWYARPSAAPVRPMTPCRTDPWWSCSRWGAGGRGRGGGEGRRGVGSWRAEWQREGGCGGGDVLRKRIGEVSRRKRVS